MAETLAHPDSAATPSGTSLMARAARGFAWVFAWRMATRVMGMASTLVLVRMLTPADFGTVAIAMSFIKSVDSFSQIGVEEALVRMPAPNSRTYDTAFTMIAMRCWLIAGIGAVAAVPVARCFDDARLVTMTLVIAGVTALAGLENVYVQDFRRELRFDKEFTLQVVPRLAGIFATIAVALVWQNYWALIIGTAVTRLGRVMMSYVMHPRRPWFSLVAWRDLVGYSLWTWAICVARVVGEQPSIFIVGRILGPAKLGLLTIGSEIASLPLTEIIMPMARSMFSAFTVAQRSGENEEVIFRRLTGLTVFVALPMSAGIALVADALVRVMLGPNWVDAVPVLQLVAVGGGLFVFAQACHAQLDAHAMLKQDFQVISFLAVCRILAMGVMVVFFGLLGAAIASAAVSLLEPVVYLLMKWRVLPYSTKELAAVTIRPVLATVGMSVLVLYAESLTSGLLGGSIGDLLFVPLMGAVTYGTLILLFWKAAGCPAGPEADVLAVLNAWWRRRMQWLI